jgi:cbb3-type cytochrome oxidase subunit 1
LSGMVLMAWNCTMTALAGKPVEASIPRATAHA